MAEEIVVIRFVRSHPPYNIGEEAGYPPVRAANLVEDGVAVFVTSAPPPDTPPPVADPVVEPVEDPAPKVRKKLRKNETEKTEE